VRDDKEIYYFKCKNNELLLIGESSFWCYACDEWHDGKEVGMVSADGRIGGDIKVSGYGYIPKDM